MTYAARARSTARHLPQRRQQDSSSCKSCRALETYAPVPFSGTIARNSRIIPPTPTLAHFFRPNNFGCNFTQATNLGENPSAFMRLSPAPTEGTVRSNSLTNNCYDRLEMGRVPHWNIISFHFVALQQSTRAVSLGAILKRRSRSCVGRQTSSSLARAQQSSDLAVSRLDSSLHRWA